MLECYYASMLKYFWTLDKNKESRKGLVTLMCEKKRNQPILLRFIIDLPRRESIS